MSPSIIHLGCNRTTHSHPWPAHYVDRCHCHRHRLSVGWPSLRTAFLVWPFNSVPNRTFTSPSTLAPLNNRQRNIMATNLDRTAYRPASVFLCPLYNRNGMYTCTYKAWLWFGIWEFTNTNTKCLAKGSRRYGVCCFHIISSNINLIFNLNSCRCIRKMLDHPIIQCTWPKSIIMLWSSRPVFLHIKEASEVKKNATQLENVQRENLFPLFNYLLTF